MVSGARPSATSRPSFGPAVMTSRLTLWMVAFSLLRPDGVMGGGAALLGGTGGAALGERDDPGASLFTGADRQPGGRGG